MNRWAVAHAGFLVISTVFSVVFHTLSILLATGTISFVALIVLYWKRWSPHGSFGWANWVTLLRLAAVIALGAAYKHFPSYIITVSGFLVLAADGADGWAARRFNQASRFGEYFDKETDAFFLLMVCMLALSGEFLGPWILVVGLLRYAFVLTRWYLGGGTQRERKSMQARVIYVLVTGALLLCFVPLPLMHLPLVLTATVLLLYSFGGDFRQIFSRKQSGRDSAS